MQIEAMALMSVFDKSEDSFYFNTGTLWCFERQCTAGDPKLAVEKLASGIANRPCDKCKVGCVEKTYCRYGAGRSVVTCTPSPLLVYDCSSKIYPASCYRH